MSKLPVETKEIEKLREKLGNGDRKEVKKYRIPILQMLNYRQNVYIMHFIHENELNKCFIICYFVLCVFIVAVVVGT